MCLITGDANFYYWVTVVLANFLYFESYCDFPPSVMKKYLIVKFRLDYADILFLITLLIASFNIYQQCFHNHY